MKINNEDWSKWLDEYKYQDSLSKKLENYKGEFDQNTINEIVLWKTNRYADISSMDSNIKLLDVINSIDPLWTVNEYNENFTREVISKLLAIDGIRLAMASTILRFRNPKIYQILDQRVYRFLLNQNYELPLTKGNKIPDNNANESAETYVVYLAKLKHFCTEHNVSFSESDKVLYLVDKKVGKEKLGQKNTFRNFDDYKIVIQ